MGNGTRVVLVCIALLWSLVPRMSVAAMPASKSAALQSSVAHSQSNSPSNDTLNLDDLFRNIEEYINEVYYFAGEISYVEFMPNGYADALIVKIGGDSLQYLHVDIEHPLRERVLIGDVVQFTGRVIGFEEYESRPVPAVLLIEYLGRLKCEGDPPTCSEITASTPASTFTLRYSAPVRSGPGFEYSIVGRVERGDTVEPDARTTDGRWLQLGEGQWLLAFLADGKVESLPVATRPPPPTPRAKATLTPTPTPTGYVVNTTARIRSGPGFDYEVVDQKTRGTRVHPIARTADGRWLQLGVEQWIFAYSVDGVRPLPVATVPPTPTPTPRTVVRFTPTPTPQAENREEVDDANSRAVRALVEQGIAKAELGQYQEAIADYDAALGLDPDHVEAWINRSLAQIRLGRYAEAIADYDAALGLDPDNAWALNYRGWAKAQLGRYAEAVADYDAALHLDPDNAWALNQRGRAKAQLGRYAEAIADHDAALRLDPDDVWTLNYRGQAKAQLGRYAEAIADYDAALRLDPDNARVRDNREQARVQMAQVSGATVNTNANLRAGPGTDYPIVGNAKKGDRVSPVAQSGSGQWLQLDSGHWIYAPLVDNVPAGLAISQRIPPTPVPPTSTPTPTTSAGTPTPPPRLVPTPTLHPEYCPDLGVFLAEYREDPQEFHRNWHDTDVCVVGLSWQVDDWTHFYVPLLPANILGDSPWGWRPERFFRSLTLQNGVVACEVNRDDMDANTARILSEINIDHAARGVATRDLRRVDILLVTGRLEINFLLSNPFDLTNCQVQEVLLEVPSD